MKSRQFFWAWDESPSSDAQMTPERAVRLLKAWRATRAYDRAFEVKRLQKGWYRVEHRSGVAAIVGWKALDKGSVPLEEKS